MSQGLRSNHFGFTIFSEDKLYYDESKQRFIYQKEAPLWQQHRLKGEYFNHQRPDLSERERVDFSRELHEAHRYLQHMASKNKDEMMKLFILMPTQYAYYSRPLVNEFLRKRIIDKPRVSHLWTWDDATRMVNLIRNEKERAKKYGLNIPLMLNETMTKKELKQKEDFLTDYFLYEMRKPPYRPKQ